MLRLLFLVVLSASMGSALPVGSVAVVRPQPEYFVGDIITFKIPNSSELLTHRVVSVGNVNGPKIYKTQGDANNVVDDWELTSKDIVGKVVFHIPYLGYLLHLPQLLYGTFRAKGPKTINELSMNDNDNVVSTSCIT